MSLIRIWTRSNQFPKTNIWLQTEKGPAVYQKMDIFQGWIWYAYKENPVSWHKLTVEQANQIIELNKNNTKASKSGRIRYGA